jgi:hypothetical protein
MRNNASTKLPYLVIAAALGAIGGALSVLFARKESREYIRERGAKGIEYLNQAGAKLHESTGSLVGKGREIIGRYRGTTDTAGESASHTEQQRDNPEMH